MQKPPEFQKNKWSSIVAGKTMPLLVWCAEHGRRITYQELDRVVVERGWWHESVRLNNYGYVAGLIGYAIQRTSRENGERIPPINAIVVNKHTGIPGWGCDYFLTHYLTPNRIRNRISLAERRRLGPKCIKLSFEYGRWGRLLKHYGLKRLSKGLPPVQDNPDDELELPTRPSRGSGGGEGEAHRRLVNYVRVHPECVRVGHRFDGGLREQWMPSGDRVDVLFENQSSLLGVECKSHISDEDDLMRGVFQCIKYREVMRAMERATRKDRDVECYLVVQTYLPPEVEQLAKRLEVEWFVVRPGAR